jgi:predicted RNA binding protein YcfA (HicA-like mRNA interferase family)
VSAAGIGREALRGIQNGPVRQVVQELMGQGWQVIRWTGKNHLLLEHSSGARVTASGTASDQHAYKMLRRSARNALRRGVPGQGS